MSYSDKSNVSYTLKDWDHTIDDVTYPSLYRLYLEMEDLTEYNFAHTHLDGWEHWEMLCRCTWFIPFVERWRKELTLKIQARALTRLKAEASSSSKNAFLANKYLVDKGWVDKTESKSSRGRPSKDDIKKAADSIAASNSRLDEDYSRLNQKEIN